MWAVSCLLSSRSSASMSSGVTNSASLSSTRLSLLIWPIERIVVPPILRARSAIIVGGGENLIGLLVEHQMIVAEMRAGHVPVKILGLYIKREHVGEQDAQRTGNIADGIAASDRSECRARE